MARYYGDFRSLDTSNDPKGQKYRVLIFTGYTGANPYEYNRINFKPDEHGMTPAPIVWPIVGTMLTMTDHPFTVSYEGDPENIFKPYRCSTAEISFLQNNINLDFLNSNGTSTLVVLLKWKNEVSEVNGHMYNRDTGETLYKKTVQDHGTEPMLYFNNYEPYKYDRFCYNVEWIGFSTPETFSMDYDSTKNAFTLNCQDALSVLQFKKYSWLGDADNFVVSASDVLFSALAELGTFSKVFITETLRISDDTLNPLHTLALQQANWFDEDGETTDLLSVLTEIFSYLNITAIPYKDTLILTTPNAIADGWGNYHVYTLPISQYIINWPAATALTYSQAIGQMLNNHLELSADKFRSGGMSISTGDVYNSVAVKCDEYPVETTLPDISDRDNLKEKSDVIMSPLDWYVSGGSLVHYHWEHQYFQSGTERIKLFQYVGSQYGDGYGTDEITDPDEQTYGYTASLYRPYCVILDDGGAAQGTTTDALHNPYNPTRKFFFNTPNITTRPSSQPWQPLLYIKSENILLNDTDYLQLKGDWVFYVNANHNFDQIPYLLESRSENAVNSYMYITAKVKCGGKWLKNGTVTYGWSSTEQTVKLYFEINAGAAFGRTFKFAKEYRNFEGIVVKLPVPAGQVVSSPVEIWINRPLGVSSTPCRNATLQNLELNILSAEYIRTRGESGKSSSNTEYKAEMTESAVNKYNDISLKLSSTSEKSARYSQTAHTDGTTLTQAQKLYNVATADLSIPEQHITQNIVRQCSTPTIGLTLAVPVEQVTPYSRITWAKLSGRKFVVNSLVYDYEADRAETDIREVKTSQTETQTTTSDITRRRRRNGDYLTDTITPRNTRNLANATIEEVTRSFNVVNGVAQLTTTESIEGNITFSADLEDGNMLLSIPNDIDATAIVDENGYLTLNFND